MLTIKMPTAGHCWLLRVPINIISISGYLSLISLTFQTEE